MSLFVFYFMIQTFLEKFQIKLKKEKQHLTRQIHYNRTTFHGEERLVNQVRGQERFVGLSSY